MKEAVMSFNLLFSYKKESIPSLIHEKSFYEGKRAYQFVTRGFGWILTVLLLER